MDLQQAKDQFNEIAEKTGILSREKEKMHPNQDERDELWNINRVFVERIYALDIDKNASQDEVNELCHFAIVALHWNDLYLSDDRFSYENGRFRRDTVALALCLFTRISRDYNQYDSLKDGWIKPHTKFSILMWTIRSIIECNQDNLFNLFDTKTAQKANELFHELSSLSGYVDLSKAPDDHPLIDIWWEIRKQFISSRIPYQFVLNYIWSGPALPGGMGLLPEDREMNKSYLKQQVVHKQFPPDWSFRNDLAYVYLFFATETDGTLADSEISQIKIKISEWISGDDEDEKKAKMEQAYDSAKLQFDADVSKERFSFALENIRRHFIKIKEGDRDKISSQLSFILEDLVAIAKADEVIIKEEYDLVEEIRLMWGIDIKLFDENIVAKFNSGPSDHGEKPQEEETQPPAEYLENYPGELYCNNQRWDSSEWSDYPMSIQPFANVFEDGEYKYDDLFRRFTQNEVDMIVNKIKSTGKLIYLPFVRDVLNKKFDMRGLKNPFWFDPFIISGAFNGSGGLFYFEQNGFYQNTYNNAGEWTDPIDMNLVTHVDLIADMRVEKGYNNYWDNLLDGEDEEKVTTLDIDWYNPGSGNSGFLSFIQTNGSEYSSTLPIVKAIWDNAWKGIVDRSKNGGCFFLGPPPFTEYFNSWDELLEWAESDDDGSSAGESDNLSESAQEVASTGSTEEQSSDQNVKQEHLEEQKNKIKDLINTVWEIIDEDGEIRHINFLENGYFKHTNIKTKNNQGITFGDSDETWKLENQSITISFNDGFKVMIGNINSNFDFMEGTMENRQGLKATWTGKIIDKPIDTAIG